jgi:hypothetical protein
MEALNKTLARLLLAIALVFTACSFGDDQAVSAANTCTKDLECGKGSVCRNDMCITLISSPLQIALQVSPASVKTVSAGGKSGNGSSPENTASSADQSVTTVLPPSRVFGSTDLGIISVPTLVEVSGDIRDLAGERVTARIDFTPVTSYPGMQVQTLTVNTAAQATEAKSDSSKTPADFVTQILQSVSYYFAIRPQEKLGSVASSDLPPFYGEFKAEKSQSNRLDISYGGDIYKSIVETTFLLRGLPTNQNFKVYAVSTSNTDRRVSTEKRISPGAGENPFVLRFLTQPGTYQLVIEPDIAASGAELDADLIYPTFRINESDLSHLRGSPVSTSDGGVQENAPIEIRVPNPGSVESYLGYIEPCKPLSQPSQTGGDKPIQKGQQTLQVTLSSKELAKIAAPNGLTGYYSATAVAAYSSKTKRFEFSVLAIPGKYQVVVSPPDDSECAVFAKTLQVQAPSEGNSAETIAIQLPLMASITGSFQTPEGKPIIGAEILAQSLRREGIDVSDQPSLTAYNRTKHTTTDEKGAFRISVDLGSYDLIAKPPAESGFGWQIFHDVNIGRPTEFPLTIAMTNPISIAGKVAYLSFPQKADALQGTVIRAYAVVADKDLGTRTVEVASATVDEKGRFQLLLSSVLNQGLY